MPAPMIAPTPRLESCTGPSTLFSRFSPFISSSKCSSDFVANSWLIAGVLRGGLYLRNRAQKVAHAGTRIVRCEQIADHGDRLRACFEHTRRSLERDAANSDNRNRQGRSRTHGLAHTFETDGVVTCVLRR